MPERCIRRPNPLVFVTVGNAPQGFCRLLEAVDQLAGNGFFRGERVLVQQGHSAKFAARYCESRAFLTPEEFQEHLRTAGLIISHGGGTLLEVVRLGKTPVAMPRRRANGEHINDHQVDFVRALVSDGWVVPAYEPGELSTAVVEARSRAPQRVPVAPMLGLVQDAIETLLRRSTKMNRGQDARHAAP